MNKHIKRIAELRDARGWTNNRMANEADIGSATVINWFARNSTPKIQAFESLCQAFGITLSGFFAKDDELLSLSEVQKEFLTEFDCLTNEEKQGLLHLLKSMNEARKKY